MRLPSGGGISLLNRQAAVKQDGNQQCTATHANCTPVKEGIKNALRSLPRPASSSPRRIEVRRKGGKYCFVKEPEPKGTDAAGKLENRGKNHLLFRFHIAYGIYFRYQLHLKERGIQQ